MHIQQVFKVTPTHEVTLNTQKPKKNNTRHKYFKYVIYPLCTPTVGRYFGYTTVTALTVIKF